MREINEKFQLFSLALFYFTKCIVAVTTTTTLKRRRRLLATGIEHWSKKKIGLASTD
jgi:hypothetical protein